MSGSLFLLDTNVVLTLVRGDALASFIDDTLLTMDKDFDHLSPEILSLQYIDPAFARPT